MDERDCETCELHHQANLAPECGDCMRSTNHYLPLWRPKMNPNSFRSCHECHFENLPGDKEPCGSCMNPYDHFVDKKHPEFAVQVVPTPVDVQGLFKSDYGKKLADDIDASIMANPNDGSTADYYVLPNGATELQDLIAYRDMNAQMGEIFRACYRYGQGHHSPRERDLKKIIFYAQAELERLSKYAT